MTEQHLRTNRKPHKDHYIAIFSNPFAVGTTGFADYLRTICGKALNHAPQRDFSLTFYRLNRNIEQELLLPNFGYKEFRFTPPPGRSVPKVARPASTGLRSRKLASP